MMVSCLGTDDYTYYDDAAISSFALGTLNAYFTVLASDSTDSVIKRTVDCSSVVFNIDQAANLIWNDDSLPIEIDITKVPCTAGAYNGGQVGVKSLTSDTVSSQSSSDSLDFSSPRIFYVYGTSGMTARAYTVTVNQHQEEGDTCIWTLTSASNADIADLTNMKALSNEEKIYLFGDDDDKTTLYTTAIDDGVTWTEVATSPTFPLGTAKTTIIQGKTFFTYVDGQVLRSDDAQYWDVVADIDIKQLIGASTANLYALSADGRSILISSDEGRTWTEEVLDDDGSFLPTEDISFACRELVTNAYTDKLVLIGNRSLDDYPNDTNAVVWSKVDEYSSGARSNKWNYMVWAGDNVYNRAPRAENWQIVNYNENNIKALSGNGIGDCKAVGLDRIFQSGDDGITWLNDSVMVLPEELSSSRTTFAFVADKVNSVWIICGGTGQIWKGRINRVAWKKEQDYFLE